MKLTPSASCIDLIQYIQISSWTVTIDTRGGYFAAILRVSLDKEAGASEGLFHSMYSRTINPNKLIENVQVKDISSDKMNSIIHCVKYFLLHLFSVIFNRVSG